MPNNDFFQKYIAEVRYIPQAEFLDMRGKIAAALTDDDFPEWQVSENKIEISGDAGLVFVTHRNAGFVTLDVNNLDKCISKIDQAIKQLNEPTPMRWGARIFSLCGVEKSFNDLMESYKKNLLNFSPEDFSSVGGKLIDLGTSYTFKKDRERIRIQTGPMEKEQASELIPKENLPQNGIFIDLDIFRESDRFYGADNRRSRVVSFLSDSFKKGQEIAEDIASKLKQNE